jgi:hypothetical protein
MPMIGHVVAPGGRESCRDTRPGLPVVPTGDRLELPKLADLELRIERVRLLADRVPNCNLVPVVSANACLESAQVFLGQRRLPPRKKAKREAAAAAAAAAAADQQSQPSNCDPNYSGCLNPNSSDYDCSGGSGNGPDYTGMVQVLGVDHYGLDADGDGIGCE